jgi:FKBP-type peptidyl-prolyl cis-trans isomerase 2
MAIKKGDFLEIEFTGRTENGEVFDTNIKEDAKKAGIETKDIKPFILAVGHKMLPRGFDDDLEGKEEGKSYSVKISPEKAFGKRESKLVRMIPTKLFHEQKIDPQRGMQLALDGQIVKILSSSGGRTLVDFNNPLAGKIVTYDYKIKRIITDEKEKINAIQDFLFKKTFNFEKKEDKIILKVDSKHEPFVKIFSGKFEEILGLKTETEIIEEKKVPQEEKKTEKEEKKNNLNAENK